MEMELKTTDFEIYSAIENEARRQREHVELIASENFVSRAVREAQGSILTNKYAEGYPGDRYYGGCEFVDIVENLAIERAKKMFNAKYANVQPHSGSQANMAVFQALIKPGDNILGMDLQAGGHLTHGFKLSFSGKDYKAHFYGVDKKTETIDYKEVLRIAKEVKPKLIICGASSYTRFIDFSEFRKIADEVGAYLLADMAHIAGLVAVGLHQNPIDYADVVTTTTHKTIRGPRGGMILTNDSEIIKKVNRAVFPGTQGGPLMHIIAAKAVAFKEALDDSFKTYQQQVIKNAKVMADEFIKRGYRVISGTTDNHMLVLDVKSSLGITGDVAQDVLESINITTNKNQIPFDTEPAKKGSGIRLGTPAITTMGFVESDIIYLVDLMDQSLRGRDNSELIKELKTKVLQLLERVVNTYDNENKANTRW